jgi:hypothetical protein
VDHGLSDTVRLWPAVRTGFALVHQTARILDNPKGHRGSAVRRRYRRLLHHIRRRIQKPGKLRAALTHFLKVTDSYWPGLFFCYDVPDLPRTNNGLEQLFGSTRHHERRCTGRKVASPSLVLRGSVRVVAGLGTRARSFQAEELAPENLETWQTVRATLEKRRRARTLRRRFRRNPQGYLRELEELLLKRVLPP